MILNKCWFLLPPLQCQQPLVVYSYINFEFCFIFAFSYFLKTLLVATVFFFSFKFLDLFFLTLKNVLELELEQSIYSYLRPT